MAGEELPLIVAWERLLGDLLDRTRCVPKAVRFTFSTRIDNLALDVLERLVEARWSGPRRKAACLKEVDLALARLRALLRLACDRGYLARRGYEHVVRGLDEAGRMAGAWRRDAEERSAPGRPPVRADR